ncbi:MAG: DUF1365 domain-containing protein [Desulfuromonadales bacterium]|nr:DUF1365 domain-containing protein [Desulfuromonadales bacterium]MBN2793358.1 DUF1365 domain-containing protein [Desulfuromonadales bacterium]
MKSGFYLGRVFHQRHLPRTHRFHYPFFMWFLNLDKIEDTPDITPWFSARRFALSRFQRSDYLGPADQPLHLCVKEKISELIGQPINGTVCGLLNLRTLGLYFSPVNFYFVYDQSDQCSHMLAEVSNTPWNERHYYALDLTTKERPLNHPKQFHVSPFNPMNQTYRWHIEPPGDSTRISIAVHDSRGQVFDATIKLQRHELSRSLIRDQLLKKPAMTAFILFGIYWQALKIYLKKIPYIPYHKEVS